MKIAKKSKKAEAVVVPVVEPKAEPKATAKKAKTAEPAKPSINKGKTTGMRVMQYQDHTLSIQHKRKLSDEALAKDWREEFPNAKGRFDAAIVAGVRRLFNAGKHGTQQIDPPKDGVARYEDGKPVAEKARAKKGDDKSQAA